MTKLTKIHAGKKKKYFFTIKFKINEFFILVVKDSYKKTDIINSIFMVQSKHH